MDFSAVLLREVFFLSRTTYRDWRSKLAPGCFRVYQLPLLTIRSYVCSGNQEDSFTSKGLFT